MEKGIDHIGVGVGGVIINREGKVFCSKRGPKARNERGKWDFPGGSVELGETLKEALVREIKEEHEFVIEPVELLGVCDHIMPDEGQHWVSPSFLCRVRAGEPKILEPEKCEQIGWFGPEEIEKLDLTQTSAEDFGRLKKRFGRKLPDLYGERKN